MHLLEVRCIVRLGLLYFQPGARSSEDTKPKVGTGRCSFELLGGGSWVVIGEVIGKVTANTTPLRKLLTLLIATHEPPSRRTWTGRRASRAPSSRSLSFLNLATFDAQSDSFQTPNPKPQSLNPKLYNLNPKPQTLKQMTSRRCVLKGLARRVMSILSYG